MAKKCPILSLMGCLTPWEHHMCIGSECMIWDKDRDTCGLKQDGRVADTLSSMDQVLRRIYGSGP